MARIFSPEINTNWLQAYLEYTKTLEAPELFHYWAGVSTIAGALQGKVWFDMVYFQWRPNFFVIIVAPPGVVNKSTTVNVGMDLLRQIPDIKFGPDSATWQAVTDSFIDSRQTYILPDGGEFQTSSITVSISELGTFLDPRNREMVDVLVDLWDGRTIPWIRKTKGEGEQKIRNPWLNLIGCTTPTWIAENFPEYAIGGGFTSRTVFLYAEAKRHLVAYPSEIVGGNYEIMRNGLIEDLSRIAKLSGPFKLDADAQQWGKEWYENLWLNRAEHLEDSRYSGYIARKQTHIHKLAMVISAAKRDTMVITLEDIQEADLRVTQTEYDMPKVFNQIGVDANIRPQVLLLALLARKNEKISKQALWKALFNQMTYENFTKALLGLKQTGLVEIIQENGQYVIVPHIPQDIGLKMNRDTAPPSS